MSDQDGAICGGCCAILCATTLGAWCNLKAFGAGNGRDSCCGGPRGCCHSCFSEGFDEDAWDKKDAEDRRKSQTAAGSSQPAPTPQMDATAPPPVNNPDAK
ncbi:hypothetical protein RSOLAG1IB_09014 [Rhizoctonia solani AG-1 IB]|uniref:Uncharacterized protein n=1 Tax=Thanatephorus cucumeris (strain AG1-IB / isolate 7/3/14) TaxID=1108050 RepID=A0A0B7FM34_THACB|nr:hypothetical protein RSOLAG1IB_09014 [Rhizoctonia solani AG-1 IB]